LYFDQYGTDGIAGERGFEDVKAEGKILGAIREVAIQIAPSEAEQGDIELIELAFQASSGGQLDVIDGDQTDGERHGNEGAAVGDGLERGDIGDEFDG
jgi:hypothetical protein